MKAVIFAGGVGTRLWPLSRKKSPKQFEKILGDQSTLQLSVQKLLPEFNSKDIYVQTGKQYVDLVAKQLDFIPRENVLGEPMRKDVGPAVCFIMGYLAKDFPNEPVAILWSDHMVKEEKKFKHLLDSAEALIKKDPNRIIFIGHKPRFASVNLGWIETGPEMAKIDDVSFRSFDGFKYRPNKELAEQYFSDGKHCWNLGYFISTPSFVYNLFKRFTPKIYDLTEKILAAKGTPEFEKEFEKYYAQMNEISFDNAVLEQLDKNFAYVVVDDIGWSDVGAWEALKEALQHNQEENITRGKVLLKDTVDSLVYNYEDKKLVVGVDLDDFLIVNTDDVLLVAKKTSVPKIKKLVESFEGTEHEHLT